MQKNPLGQDLIAAIDQRFRMHTDKSLHDYVYANHLFQSYDPTFFEYALSNRQNVLAYLSQQKAIRRLAEYCVDSIKRYTYKKNQYINYSRQYNNLLYSIYHDFILRISQALDESESVPELSHAFRRISKLHHERLKRILAAYCESMDNRNVLLTVPCEEYSASLQEQIFGIDVPVLKEPILDIGCGSKGMLVNALYEKGFQVHGIDRFAPSAGPFTQLDWFEFDFQPAHWGTVIAHHSVSTHFLYCHLHEPQNAEKYARLYMNVLSSLKSGGSFFYAPGLPFMEAQLLNTGDYTVTRREIPLPATDDRVQAVAYATTIRRMRSESRQFPF